MNELKTRIYTNERTKEKLMVDLDSGQVYKLSDTVAGLGDWYDGAVNASASLNSGDGSSSSGGGGSIWTAILNTATDIFGIIQSGADAWSSVSANFNQGQYQFGPTGNTVTTTPPPPNTSGAVPAYMYVGGAVLLTIIIALLLKQKPAPTAAA